MKTSRCLVLLVLCCNEMQLKRSVCLVQALKPDLTSHFLFYLTKPGTNSYFCLKPPFRLEKSCLEHWDAFIYWFLLKSALFDLCCVWDSCDPAKAIVISENLCFNSDCCASKCWPPVTCYLSSMAHGSHLCLEEKYQWRPLIL